MSSVTRDKPLLRKSLKHTYGNTHLQTVGTCYMSHRFSSMRVLAMVCVCLCVFAYMYACMSASPLCSNAELTQALLSLVGVNFVTYILSLVGACTNVSGLAAEAHEFHPSRHMHQVVRPLSNPSCASFVYQCFRRVVLPSLEAVQ